MRQGVPIGVLVYGFGAIGQAIAAATLQKRCLRLVGVVDKAPGLAGKPVAEFVAGAPAQLRISPCAGAVANQGEVQVALHATGSRLHVVAAQYEELLGFGLDVISTCEEACFPVGSEAAAIASRLDRLCREKGTRLLGTGVNPGFAMDFWPLIASAAATSLIGISVRRVLDAGQRREALQRKVGAGLTEQEFLEGLAAGTLGHVGLANSAHMLAAGLGCNVVTLSESCRPVIAQQELRTPYLAIPPGRVAGLEQELQAELSSGLKLSLSLLMAVGASPTYDEIQLTQAKRQTRIVVDGGFHGDETTAALVVNTVLPLRRLPPGYYRMIDLPAFGCAP